MGDVCYFSALSTRSEMEQIFKSILSCTHLSISLTLKVSCLYIFICHCFISSDDARILSCVSSMNDIGKLPDVVFYQVDGGSENVAKVVFVICELLIIRKLTKKVVLTRLLVGHTHLDIDGVFGKLWTSLRVRSTYSSLIKV